MRLNSNFIQIMKYIFYSVLTTLVNWIFYSCFIFLLRFTGFRSDTKIFIANLLAWFFAVTFSFVVNKLRVFKSTAFEFKAVLSELLKFFSTRFAVGCIEIAAVPVLVFIGLNGSLFGIDGMISKVIITPVLIILNYIFGKFFVFGKNNSNATCYCNLR